jgi:hypothetical protein
MILFSKIGSNFQHHRYGYIQNHGRTQRDKRGVNKK